jgi:hypothetical protein
VTNTWALVASAELPAVTHVLCRKVRCSVPPVTSLRLHCTTVPSHRPSLAPMRSQVVQLSHAAIKIGVSTEQEALQQLQGDASLMFPHPYVLGPARIRPGLTSWPRFDRCRSGEVRGWGGRRMDQQEHHDKEGPRRSCVPARVHIHASAAAGATAAIATTAVAAAAAVFDHRQASAGGASQPLS